MKVIVSAALSSEPRPHDFNFAAPAELLTVPVLICPTAEERESCGCGRCFDGIGTAHGTTFGVATEIDRAEVHQRFEASRLAESWALGSSIEETVGLLWQDLEGISNLLQDEAQGSEVRVENDRETFALFRTVGELIGRSERPAGLGAFVHRAIAARQARDENA